MRKPSRKWLTVAAAGCIFASSMGTYTYKALANEFVYSDANVSITSIVDRYIEENGGDVFVEATPEDATAVAATAEIADATATDAIATGEVREVAAVTGSIKEVSVVKEETTEETTEEITTETTTEAATTEVPAQQDSVVASPVMDFTGKAVVTASGTVNIRQSGDVNAAKVGTIDAGGLVNVAEKYIAAHRTVETELDLNAGFTAKDVCDAAKAGDIAGLAAVEESMRLLGKAMASVSCVIDPQVFVVGGGLSKAGNIIIDTASKYYKEYAFHASRETEIKLATLGNAAGMYGGVKMVIG